jgi:hypothetical protein
MRCVEVPPVLSERQFPNARHRDAMRCIAIEWSPLWNQLLLVHPCRLLDHLRKRVSGQHADACLLSRLVLQLERVVPCGSIIPGVLRQLRKVRIRRGERRPRQRSAGEARRPGKRRNTKEWARHQLIAERWVAALGKVALAAEVQVVIIDREARLKIVPAAPGVSRLVGDPARTHRGLASLLSPASKHSLSGAPRRFR